MAEKRKKEKRVDLEKRDSPKEKDSYFICLYLYFAMLININEETIIIAAIFIAMILISVLVRLKLNNKFS